jgi:hypothetical protein
LAVDFVGGVGFLTKEEEKQLSEVIKVLKTKKSTIPKPTRKLKTEKKYCMVARWWKYKSNFLI